MISAAVPGLGVALDRGVRSLVRGVAAVLLSACFYIDPINTAPTATIQVPSGPYFLNQSVTFTAVAIDPDGDKMSFQWFCNACIPNFGTSQIYRATFAAHGSVEVRLIVTDSHGAGDTPFIPITITDRAPTNPVIFPSGSNLDGTYTVTKPIQLTANASDDDNDSITFSAVVHPPPTSDPNHMQFTPSPPKTWTLVPDVPGHWTVDVTAADGFGGSATSTQSIEVLPDQPPCIAVTVPDANSDGHYLVLRDDGPRRFAVASVTDDLDGFPGQLHLNWSLGRSGSVPAPVAGHDFSDFTIDPAAYLPGDVVELRVEVTDRVARTLPCAADQPRCSIGGNNCFQRETWEVEIR